MRQRLQVLRVVVPVSATGSSCGPANLSSVPAARTRATDGNADTGASPGGPCRSSAACSRDSLNAIRRSASVVPNPRFQRWNRSATATLSSG